MGIHFALLITTTQIIMFFAFLLVLVAVATAEECGKPEVQGIRVIAGKTAVRGSWPWQVLMKFGGRASCGGTLIAPQWVVTAAHCVYRREGMPYMFSVVLGEHDRERHEGSEQEIQVMKVFRHPQYSPHVLNNDIAMFKLMRPAKLGKYVKTACMPSQDPPAGSKCYITGWGKTRHPGSMTRVLQQGLLPVVSNKACYKKNHVFIPIPITNAMICGGDGGISRLSGCHGDSGGPYVCNINGRWELHGSVSHGSPVCSSSQTYTVFSRTNYFKSWIQSTMRR